MVPITNVQIFKIFGRGIQKLFISKKNLGLNLGYNS